VALKQEYREFAERFASAIVVRDFTSAHAMLAPWLQRSMTADGLARMIQNEVQETAEINEIEGELHPGTYEIDSNSCSLQDLQEPRSYAKDRDIAPEVTAENFRQWMVIQFQPAEDEDLEIDAYVDFWMIVVEIGGEYKIGYFEMEDPD
jgi:hypothetical protein